MTRFKELQRIENAIVKTNQTDLEWALGYCIMRIQLSRLKVHRKYWLGVEKRVRTALKTSTGHTR